MSVFINDMVAALIAYGTVNLITIMIIVFFIALVLKFLLYYLLKSEFNLSSAFETRTHRYLNNRYAEGQKLSKFSEVVEFILRKTYNEMYVTRKKQLRKRKMDPSVAVLNRMFLVEDGARTLIDDTLRQTKYHDAGRIPDFRNIAKFVSPPIPISPSCGDLSRSVS